MPCILWKYKNVYVEFMVCVSQPTFFFFKLMFLLSEKKPISFCYPGAGKILAGVNYFIGGVPSWNPMPHFTEDEKKC